MTRNTVHGLFIDYCTDEEKGRPQYLWGLYSTPDNMKDAMLEEFGVFYGDTEFDDDPELPEIYIALTGAKDWADLIELAEKAKGHRLCIEELTIH